MVLNHQKFDLRDKCLIEKVIIQAPFRFTGAFQNEACFIYFWKGKSKVNSPYEQVPIKPEESLLLKCGSYFADLMKDSISGRYEILVVHLYPDILREIYKHEVPSFVKGSQNKSFINKVVPGDIIKKFIESLYFYFDNPALVSDELLELKVRELVLLLIQSKSAESLVTLFADLFTPRQVSIKEVLNSHIFSGLSIEDLASLTNLSVSTFNRTFQTLFNDTPANYIKTKRLEHARELLAASTLSIGEIAFQTCFNDVAHFSRSFKDAYHCSPSDYRLSSKS
jgi:AraC family transcriptional regulator, exoenzyme S synthesis regulatory protein ExsA